MKAIFGVLGATTMFLLSIPMVFANGGSATAPYACGQLGVILDTIRTLESGGDYEIRNGSGLSRDTVFHASALTALLVDMAHDEKVGSEFNSALAIAGVDGTLSRRLREDPSRMRGKTGTLDGVHCLAGYIDAADGERYAFAFLANGDRATSASVKALQDRFARALLDAPPGAATADGSDSED